MVDTAKERV